MPETAASSILPPADSAVMVRRRRWRMLKDRCFAGVMQAGGLGVILAITLIFVYLMTVVVPLFIPASAKLEASFVPPGGGRTVGLFSEEYGEIGLRVNDAGTAFFFRLRDGRALEQVALLGPSAPAPVSIARGDPDQHAFALGLKDGSAVVARYDYRVSYPNDVRTLTPEVAFPLGREPVEVDEQGHPLRLLAVQSQQEEGTTLVAVTDDDRVLLVNFQVTASLLGEGEGELERTQTPLPVAGRVTHLALDVDQRELYLVTDDGHLHYFDVQDKAEPRLLDVVSVAPAGSEVTALEFLAGGISILVGHSSGRIEQWFPVRDAQNNYHLAHVRGFRLGRAPVTAIAPEFYRKGFLATDAAGRMGIFHSTSERTLLRRQVDDGPISKAVMLPHADGALLIDEGGRLQHWAIDNEHPEVSWKSLWGKVWYESRGQPEWIWQSSSASNDFEPKFSLTPLAFGTLKATVYAMLFAIPLGVLGALFAGYFMHPSMRRVVKPSVEVMAALPTVILGFLAGLWLAPLAEHNLPGILLILLLTPPALVGAGWLWDELPEGIRRRVPEGLQAALLIPVVLLTIWLAMVAGHPLEELLFNGNMPAWITRELGIPFDQRNSLVVGIAMGFAVIPTIFSISEDGVHSVPRHLIHGSLALGATPWQTLWRVVLPTASPAIFSALMIGLGRAVGETMIVLMATGNTPVVDFNIFTGFRALSANVAVEMPETEVNSTHYRVLFLAALVLFLATFLINTAGEIVRQRLRRRYSSL